VLNLWSRFVPQSLANIAMRRGSWHGGNGISILQLDLMSSCWWSFCNSKNVSTKKFWALLEHSISEDNILEDSTHDHKYVEQGNLEPIPLPSLCHPFAQDKKHKFTDYRREMQERIKVFLSLLSIVRALWQRTTRGGGRQENTIRRSEERRVCVAVSLTKP